MATNNLNDLDLDSCIEELQNKSIKLRALLTSIVGEGGEAFRRLNDEVQDSFLWTCRDMAKELCGLIEQAEAQMLKATPISR